jgi:hypothetical protein
MRPARRVAELGSLDHFARTMHRLTDTELLAEIEAARQLLLQGVQSPPVGSILRQLDWGRRRLLGESVEQMPGPFTMGIIAVRELDGFPEASERVSLIQSELEAREPVVVLSDAEKRRRKQEYRESHL